MVEVLVTLGGQPVAGATVAQGGAEPRWQTDAKGMATVALDPTVNGEKALIASHPEARTGAVRAPRDGSSVQIDLERFMAVDNEAYTYFDPGEPDRGDSTAHCSHCHVTMIRDWIQTPHRDAARADPVQDLYAGAAAALDDSASCQQAGGTWALAAEPGTDNEVHRCFLGAGVIPDLNPDCGPGLNCSTPPTNFGQCADCHAPAMEGPVGGRDLLEARGPSFEYGVHCDFCHKVEAVDLSSTSPGVAGRLRLQRPAEVAPSPGFGDWTPMFFGPYDDVANSAMGAVPRALFSNGEICAGCHEHRQEVLVPGGAIDLQRWPTGRLPIHTTRSEWEVSQWNPGHSCVECHMPGDPVAGNSADLGNEFDIEPGIVGGWYRPVGSVRRHNWLGPRSQDRSLIEDAARLVVDTELDGSTLEVSVAVVNVGAGHAIPTGEPMRSLVLVVRATCTGVDQPAVGGAAVPDFGGALAVQDSAADWSRWPGAQAGQVVRVVRRPGAWHDYPGFGPFGDGTFDPQQKGMPVEDVVGQSTIVGVQGDLVTFDRPLPTGDVAYRSEAPPWPTDGAAAGPWAGAAGFGFARVLSDAHGNRMVPHHSATDVVSDNRIPAGTGYRTDHIFEVSCPTPEVRAILVHRAYPTDLARQRGWDLRDTVLIEEIR
jgi:hypothetical protein